MARVTPLVKAARSKQADNPTPAGKPARQEPGLRTQWLATELRSLRENAGLSLADVGAYIQRDQSTISRMEKAIIPIRVPDVLAYLDLARVDDTNKREMLKQLAHEIWRNGWWDGYAGDAAAVLIDRLWVESRTQRIKTYQMLIPGLLQTRDHAEAVMRAVNPEVPDATIERWLQLRMEQQQVLDAKDSLALHAILDEAVLHRPVGKPAVHRAQLEHLLEMSASPTMEIRILPASTGAHAGMVGGFELMELVEPFPAVGYVETQVGSIFVEGEKVDRLRAAYDDLSAAAFDVRRSVAMIKSVLEDLE
ncbi:MAG: helix-turn-helix transcriptional regulator [Actinocatenispora sp.]